MRAARFLGLPAFALGLGALLVFACTKDRPLVADNEEELPDSEQPIGDANAAPLTGYPACDPFPEAGPPPNKTCNCFDGLLGVPCGIAYCGVGGFYYCTAAGYLIDALPYCPDASDEAGAALDFPPCQFKTNDN